MMVRGVPSEEHPLSVVSLLTSASLLSSRMTGFPSAGGKDPLVGEVAAHCPQGWGGGEGGSAGLPVEGQGRSGESGHLLLCFPFNVDGPGPERHWAVLEGASFGDNHTESLLANPSPNW